jgi:hypothetical protein
MQSLRLLVLVVLALPARAYAPAGRAIPAAPLPELPFSPSPFLVTVQTALTPDLYGISHLESNNGLHVNHEPSIRGPFYTALGHLGLKPSTAWGFYQKSPILRMRYPGLDQDTFFEKLRTDVAFYNEVASTGFQRMKRHFGLPRSIFAWRWGDGAAEDASEADIRADAYVGKYMNMSYPHGYQPKTGMAWPARGEELEFVQAESSH